MQHDIVWLIGDSTKIGFFFRRRICEQTQAIIRMGRKEHLVKGFPFAALHFDFDADMRTANRVYRCSQPEGHALLFHRVTKAADIFDGTTLHRVPLMLSCCVQQGVVLEELDHGMGRKLHDLLDRRGPDRAGQGQKVIVAEPIACSQLFQKMPGGQATVPCHIKGICVEAQDVSHHADKLGVHDIALLGEQSRQACQGIFQRTALERGPETHVRFGDRHIKPVEQRGHMRIVGVVEHDKACIDRLITAFSRHDGSNSVT